MRFDPQLGLRGINVPIVALLIHKFKCNVEDYQINPIVQSVVDWTNQHYTLEKIKNNEIISKYRAFYWKYLNIDPTKTRPASEALIRRILAQKPLPKISLFVDLYNLASIKSLISLGAYDFDKINLPISIRPVVPGEKFKPIGKDAQIIPETAIVTSDANQTILCQYPYRDSEVTMVTSTTQTILLLAYGVNGISNAQLESSIQITLEFLNQCKDQGILEFQVDPIQLFNQSY